MARTDDASSETDAVYAAVQIDGTNRHYVQARKTDGTFVALLALDSEAVDLGNVSWTQVGPNRADFWDASEDAASARPPIRNPSATNVAVNAAPAVATTDPVTR